jgi:hypothetical protein
MRYHRRSVAERDSVPFAASHRRAAGLRGTNGGDTRWWVGMDNAHYTEKCLGVELAPLNAENPTSRAAPHHPTKWVRCARRVGRQPLSSRISNP